MGILDFIFPKRCVSCGAIGQYFCRSCRTRIRPIEIYEAICPVCERSAIGGATHPKCRGRYTIDGLTSFFHYDGVIRKAIKVLKYRSVFDIAAEFVSLAALPDLSADILIPIPLHISKLRERGYNQAEGLGRILAKQLNIPIQTAILLRTRKTIAQVAMKDRKSRLTNMEKAFGLAQTGKSMPQGTSVLLFDDVFTTGATMRAAANVLKRAGAKNVWAVTMAR